MIKDTMLTRIGNDCDEKSTKFLGILFDENLTWRDHVSHVNKKISRALFSLKQVRIHYQLNAYEHCIIHLYIPI